MTRIASLLVSVVAAVVVVGGAVPAVGSLPANVRVRPVRVVEEPARPARVLIQGVFALTDSVSGKPLPPRCGAMYFECRTEASEPLCKAEWADIQRAALAGTCVAFAASVRTSVEDAVAPLGTPPPLHPWDPHMGIPTVPCSPQPPSPERPDLAAVPCAPSTPDAAAPPPPDAGAPRPAPDAANPPPVTTLDAATSPADRPAPPTPASPDAPAASGQGGGAPPSAGAGGSGAGGASSGAGGAAGAAPRMASRGCAVARARTGRDPEPTDLFLPLLAAAAIGVHRARRRTARRRDAEE